MLNDSHFRLTFQLIGICDIFKAEEILLQMIIADDFCRLACILSKCLVGGLPFISIRTKGTFYFTVSVLLMLYRFLMPVLPWYYYLYGCSTGLSWFSLEYWRNTILLIIFLALKVWFVETHQTVFKKEGGCLLPTNLVCINLYFRYSYATFNVTYMLSSCIS